MKIGILSQWYSPEPAFIPSSLAKELATRGHQVRVLTGYPNYPLGRIYPGYRQRWREQATADRLTVRRVPLYPSHDTSAARRALNYLSFAATSSLTATRYFADLDVLYVYHPPATAFAAAALTRFLGKVPLVLHVQDVWPESVTASPMMRNLPGGAVHRMLDLLMRRIYSAAASIVVIAPSMRDLLIQRGADPSRVRVVLNWADEELFRPVKPSEWALRAVSGQRRCTVMYAGNLGPFQGVDVAVRAASETADSGLDLVLVGSGTEERSIRCLIRELDAGNVRLLGRRAPEDIASLYAAADFQLVMLRGLPALHGTIPSKLQAAFACGSPVLASADGDCARIVDSVGAGFTCAPDSSSALAAQFVRAAQLSAQERINMGRRAYVAYKESMSMKVNVDHIEEELEIAAGRTGRDLEPV